MQLFSSTKTRCAFFVSFLATTIAVPIGPEAVNIPSSHSNLAYHALKAVTLEAQVTVPSWPLPQLSTHDPIVAMVNSITPRAVDDIVRRFSKAKPFLNNAVPMMNLNFNGNKATPGAEKFDFKISFTARSQNDKGEWTQWDWPSQPEEIYGQIDIKSLAKKGAFDGSITSYPNGRSADNKGVLLESFENGELTNFRSSEKYEGKVQSGGLSPEGRLPCAFKATKLSFSSKLSSLKLAIENRGRWNTPCSVLQPALVPSSIQSSGVTPLFATDLTDITSFAKFARGCVLSFSYQRVTMQGLRMSSKFLPEFVERSLLIDLKVPQTTLDSDLFPDVPTPTTVPVHPVFEHEHSLTASGILSEVTRLMERNPTNNNNVTLVKRFNRFNNKKDVIPIVPGQFLGFEHPQGEIHLLGNDNAVSCPVPPTSSLGDDDAFARPFAVCFLGLYQGVDIGTLFCAAARLSARTTCILAFRSLHPSCKYLPES
ncbi:hypothetical protein F5890DRAFT_1472239 [Lentinula detonsa]|uniref:Uncharacterized protein n=1 Tax=Lentinula detonsa TaxID=2804962 RepID=A0AA38Q4L8_9AGAR|nr:hypothetical protein F5890DRAFT_1472239 [Lentinula detonsa]